VKRRAAKGTLCLGAQLAVAVDHGGGCGGIYREHVQIMAEVLVSDKFFELGLLQKNKRHRLFRWLHPQQCSAHVGEDRLI